MLALLQSAALQRFCSNIEYQILIPVTEGLPWPVAHKHLARAPLLVPSLVLTHSPGPAFLLCPCIVLSPPQWIWLLCGISHGSLCSCQPFWCPQTCGRPHLSWVMLHQLCLCSADEIWMPEESAENAEGSQGTYGDVLVLQVTHMLYLRVKTCTVVCIWC